MDRVDEILYLYEDVEGFADGGSAGQLVRNTVDGSRPGYGGPGSGAKKGSIPRLTSAEKKATYYKKLLNDLPEGYLEDYKKIFLNDRGDGIFSRKPGDAPEGILDMEKKYKDILKGKTKNITRRVGEMNSAILHSLQEEGKIVSGLSDARNIRKADLKIVGDIDLVAPKGMAKHHFMPLAGIEGEKINLSSTKNTAFIDKKLNEKMAPYDKKLKANQKEQIKLLNEKPTGYKIRIKQLNYKAKNIYKDAGKKVPGSKGYLGYSQINVKPDGTYNIKVTGIDSSKSAAGLKGEEILYKNISKADKIKVEKIFKDSGIPFNKKGFNQLVKEAADGKGSKQAISKLTNFTKGMRALKGAAKWTGYGVLAEIGFMVPFAAMDYAAGESWKRILGNATDYGFGPILGQSEQEEFEAALPKGSASVQAEEVLRIGNQLTDLEQRQANPGAGRPGLKKRVERGKQKVYDDTFAEYVRNMQPFLRPSPHLEGGRFYDQELFNKAMTEGTEAREAIADREAKTKERRSAMNEFDEEIFQYKGYAGGGIAGIRRRGAIPPESGPQPQGLENLKYYVTNT